MDSHAPQSTNNPAPSVIPNPDRLRVSLSRPFQLRESGTYLGGYGSTENVKKKDKEIGAEGIGNSSFVVDLKR